LAVGADRAATLVFMGALRVDQADDRQDRQPSRTCSTGVVSNRLLLANDARVRARSPATVIAIELAFNSYASSVVEHARVGWYLANSRRQRRAGRGTMPHSWVSTRGMMRSDSFCAHLEGLEGPRFSAST
jgi:hypothetical protein